MVPPVTDVYGNKRMESRVEGHSIDIRVGAVGSRDGIGDGLKGRAHFKGRLFRTLVPILFRMPGVPQTKEMDC